MIDNNLYFILSTTCKLINGYKRSLIVDYSRDELFFISNEYYDLLLKLDRQRIIDVEKELEDVESVSYFNEFLSFMINNEIAIMTNDAKKFPPLSEVVHDEYVKIQDVIIELDELFYDDASFRKLCKELTEVNCTEFQVRILSILNLEFLEKIMQLINTTEANYLEIHATYNAGIDIDLLHKFIENNAIISNIYLYGSTKVKKYSIVNQVDNYQPISLGTVYFLNYPFDNGNCCGLINFESLDFSGFYYTHNKHKTRNGCLDKKISIDKKGNIKNCPSMKEVFGNINDVTIKNVLTNPEFLKYWYIHKDKIEICRDCEFRYNCSDCRAFIQNINNIYSKPSKCSYNPYTCEW
ncbi:MAG: grasp-with-spasm system SPASM domain peptide maturase [Paludibacter sp.]|nr:grasp-with-spasm system SPASM domain peptide maturase [Paludibacter sp.]